MTAKRMHVALLASAVAVLIASGVAPRDYGTWAMEIAPVFIGGVILVATYARFRLTTLTYSLIWLFAIILIVGGHYGYVHVPPGRWVSDALGLDRNHYDRFGHFFQGLVPAMLAREVLLRTSPLRPGKWLFFLVCCVALAISAAYEMIEWWSAVAGGEAVETDFVASQGDPWDAQWDMFLALCGAIVGQLALSRVQDRALEQRSAGRRRDDRPPHHCAAGGNC